jgi:integrase
MGTITKRREGGRTVWRARFPDPARPGKRVERRFDLKGDAERWLDAQKGAQHNGTFIAREDGQRLLRLVIEDYRRSILPRRAPKTRRDYNNILDKHIEPRFGDYRVGAISTAAIQEYANDLADSKAPNTVHHIISVLRAVMKLAKTRRYIAVNPCSEVELPPARTVKHRREYTTLTAAEVRQLAFAIEPEYRALILLAGFLGPRAGELRALQRKHIDLEAGTLHIGQAMKDIAAGAKLDVHHWRLTPSLVVGPTKTYAVRDIRLPAFLVNVLREHLERRPNDPDALVFATEEGSPIRQSLFYSRKFKPAVRRALPASKHGLRFHDLRHTAAELTLDLSPGDYLAVKERLGHKSIETTIDLYGKQLGKSEAAINDALEALYREAEREPGERELRAV